MVSTFLVPAYPGCSGKKAVKRVSVCLSAITCLSLSWRVCLRTTVHHDKQLSANSAFVNNNKLILFSRRHFHTSNSVSKFGRIILTVQTLEERQSGTVWRSSLFLPKNMLFNVNFRKRHRQATLKWL